MLKKLGQTAGLFLALLAPAPATFPAQPADTQAPAARAWLEAHPVVVVGMHSKGWLPFEGFQGATPTGFAYETLLEANRRLGIHFQVRRYDDWSTLLQDACEGKLDLVLTVALTAERTRCLIFSRPYIESPVALVSRRDNQRVRSSGDLAGLKIVTESDFSTSAVARERFSNAANITADDTDAALREVADGGADVYLGNPYVASLAFHRPGLENLGLVRPSDLPQDTLHFAAPNANAPLIEALDEALDAIPSARRTALRQRWLPELQWDQSRLTLSERERQTLPKVIRAGIPDSRAPIAFMDARDGPSGFVMEYINRFHGIGANIETKGYDPAELSRLARRGELDAIAGIPDDSNIIAGWVVSEPLVTVPNVIVTRVNSKTLLDISDLRGKKVAVSDPLRVGIRLKSAAPRVEIVSYPTAEGGLRALRRSEVAAYVGNLAVVERALRDQHAGALHIAAPAGIEDRIVLAAPPENRAIVTSFNRLLASLPSREREAIRGDWLAVDLHSGVDWRRVLSWAVPFGLLALAAGVIFISGHIRLRAEVAQRSRAESRLNDIVSSLPAVVYQAELREDGSAKLLFVSENMEDLLGVSANAVIADEGALYALMHPDDRDQVRSAAKLAFAESDQIDIAFRAESMDGWRWVRSHSKPSLGDQDALIWTGYWIDVTKSYLQARDLAEAKAAAENAAAAKAEFLATMSHEIRTPMGGVLGMLEVLDHTELDEEQRRVLSYVNDSAQILRQILDDILDFSKIQAGRMSLSPNVSDVRALVSSVVHLLSPQAVEKGIELTMRADSSVAGHHWVDALRLKQVLFNLLSNAIKFTNAGSVEVEVLVTRTESRIQTLQLSVRDTGIGVSAEQQSRLFAPFAQAEASISREYGGTGLGLAICRRLIDLMGGSLAFDSTLGQGTVVVVHLTLPIAEAPPALHDRNAATAADDWTSYRVLVAEDHPTKQILMRWRLEQLNLTGDVVEDGLAALHRIKSESYDLLITDCIMPNMDGYELARSVRIWEQSTGQSRIPIIALTANAMDDDVRRCLEAGMDDFMAKPVDLLTLRNAISRWLPAPPPMIDEPRAANHPSDATIDWLDELSRTVGSMEVAHDLVLALAASTSLDMRLLHTAIGSGDQPEVLRLLHRVLGGFGTIGHVQLTDRIAAIMSDLRSEGLRSASDKLAVLMADVSLWIERWKGKAGTT